MIDRNNQRELSWIIDKTLTSIQRSYLYKTNIEVELYRSIRTKRKSKIEKKLLRVLIEMKFDD
jgi:hypothetical protein